MPIRFRCRQCNRLLGIARRKIGAVIACPQCGAQITVPDRDDADLVPDAAPAANGALDLSDIDELLNPTTQAKSAPPAAPAMATRTAPPPAAKKKEEPLFLGDVDEMLGLGSGPAIPIKSPPAKSKPEPDAEPLSLDPDPPSYTVSAGRATILVAAVLLLLALAFAAGYFIAR